MSSIIVCKQVSCLCYNLCIMFVVEIIILDSLKYMLYFNLVSILEEFALSSYRLCQAFVVAVVCMHFRRKSTSRIFLCPPMIAFTIVFSDYSCFIWFLSFGRMLSLFFHSC